MILAVEFSKQVIFSGLVTGFTYGVLAIGLILIYRSTRVINFAHGEVGAFCAGLLALLVTNYNWNFYVALTAVIIAGGVIGAVVELAVVRRLFTAPRVILFVATLGVAQLVLVAQLYLPRLESFGGYPTAFDEDWEVWGIRVQSEHVMVLIVVPILTVLLAWFLGATKYGTAIRASATNADAARLNGIRIKAMSTMVWVIAGVLAAVTVVLIAPLRSASAADTVALGPTLLLRALAAGLIGRMRSMPIALAAGAGIGVIEALLFFNDTTEPGRIDLLLFIVVLGAVLLEVRSGESEEPQSWSFAPRVRAIPANIEDKLIVRRLPQIGTGLALLAAVLLPIVFSEASRQFLYSRMLLFAAVAVSLTILTGWAGQLSLGQFAFVGLGAVTTYALVTNGMSFEAAVLFSGVVGLVSAMIVGAPALRVKGLFLAVTTLAFAVMAENFLLDRGLFTGGESVLFLPRAEWGDSFSLEPQRTYYYLTLIFLVLVIIVALNIRRSGVGRSMIAVRDNEPAASAFAISPTRIKLTAFGLGGAIAGLAGGLFSGLLVSFQTDQFAVEQSLRIVSIAVIGGLASVAGAVLGALWVIGLPALFSDSQEIALLTSGIGLLVLLLYFPGGLVQILYSIRDALYGYLSKRAPEVETERVADVVPGSTELHTHHARDTGMDKPALEVEGVSVKFGARKVVDDVSLTVQPGEVVGLIGANGAGKTTLMNAVGGYVPSTGDVHLHGTQLTGRSASARARVGLGRAFQNASLFGDLTVRETVQTALEARAPTRLVPTLLTLPRARKAERAKRTQADELINFFGLGRYADRFVDELSTGSRRIVELACLVGVDARVLCLDEPTAGVAQRETEAFGPLIVRLGKELDASLLVIEHDMPLIMSISDRVYCLEAGQVIAEGEPDAVRNDPAVVASYLGTDERAIARSDG